MSEDRGMERVASRYPWGEYFSRGMKPSKSNMGKMERQALSRAFFSIKETTNRTLLILHLSKKTSHPQKINTCSRKFNIKQNELCSTSILS